jgi:hypothetical protein
MRQSESGRYRAAAPGRPKQGPTLSEGCRPRLQADLRRAGRPEHLLRLAAGRSLYSASGVPQ